MYEYLWRPDVLDTLADIYVQSSADERSRMAAGVEAFNARLATDPMSVGESRAGDLRVALPSLLRVYFLVDQAERRVRVVGVKRYGR